MQWAVSKADFANLAADALVRSQKKADELTRDAGEKLEDNKFMQALAAAQGAVDKHAMRLFGLVENYPQLRSSDNFLSLQDQLEGTENRINVARMVFNESVRVYNSAIRNRLANRSRKRGYCAATSW